MAIKITGDDLTIEDVVAVARHGEKITIDREASERIKTCRAMLERKINAREIMYGVNTGIGELSEVVLTAEEVEKFQTYLIYNHAAGIGDPFPVEQVRAAISSQPQIVQAQTGNGHLEPKRHLVDGIVARVGLHIADHDGRRDFTRVDPLDF